MTPSGKRGIALLIMTLLILSVCASFGLSEPYNTLREGDSGEEVKTLKMRMYELGYFKSTDYSDIYNQTTAERVRQLQKKNGLKQTGVATPELQRLIFSDECVAYSGISPEKAAQTAAPESPGTGNASWPEMNEEGFLLPGAEPYLYENQSDGLWLYISRDIHIEIRRLEDPDSKLIWFETSIALTGDAKLRSMLVPGKKKSTLKQPADIMKPYGSVVLAFSDDFFGYRTRYEKKNEGIIIRDGQVLAESTVKASSKKFPPLEVLALFEDGSMRTFESNEKTAREYLDMGVTDTFAFGPILVKDGAISQGVYAYDKTKREPRTALGMIAPRRYMVLTALGRRKDSKGASFLWLAEKMLEKGVLEAINLDGGNTCSLIFNGKMINRPANVKKGDIRYVSGLIGIIEEEE